MKFNDENFSNDNGEATIKKPVNPESQKVLKSGVFLIKTFLFLALGLFISAAVAVGGSILLSKFVYNSNAESNVGLITTLCIVFGSFIGCIICSVFISKLGLEKGNKAVIPYVIYSFLMGILLSGLVYWAKNPYILGFAFLITSLLFVALGIVGYFAKGKAWPIVLTAAAFIVLAGFAIYFFTFLFLPFYAQSESYTQSFLWIMFAIQIGFLVVMCIYTAFDFYRIRKVMETEELTTNISVYFASQLYSDFVLLFIYLIRIIASIKK